MTRGLLTGCIVCILYGTATGQAPADSVRGKEFPVQEVVVHMSPFRTHLKGVFPAFRMHPSAPIAGRTENPVTPFFCRIESGIARRSQVAFRFRLGSLAYSDWMEGRSSILERDR